MTFKHNNKMKYAQFIFIFAAMLCATACQKIDKTDPIYTNQSCTIVYTVDNSESRTLLKSESEWDALLNQFCNYAEEGKSVTFHNLNSHITDVYASKGFIPSKEGTTPTSITTSNREELKAWMRKMEQAGKTVNIKYDRNTGVWSGRAYANTNMAEDTTAYTTFHGVITSYSLTGLDIPSLPYLNVMALYVNADTTLLLVRDNYLIEAESGLEGYQIGDTATLSGQLMVIEDFDSTPLLVLDITTTNPATVVGTWQYTCLTEYAIGNGLDYLNMVTQSIPEENGNSIYFIFNSDGTATRTVGNSSTLSVSGNWSLTNGQFCCDLPDMSGDCWDIVWLTSSTMIITRTDNTNGGAIYQMMLEQTQR